MFSTPALKTPSLLAGQLLHAPYSTLSTLATLVNVVTDKFITNHFFQTRFSVDLFL